MEGGSTELRFVGRLDFVYIWRAMAASDTPSKNERFVVLRHIRDTDQALLFKSVLDSAGIESFLADENTIRMDWLWSNAIGGIKLCVREADAEEASRLLDAKETK
jgi:hypothetical protein